MKSKIKNDTKVILTTSSDVVVDSNVEDNF